MIRTRLFVRGASLLCCAGGLLLSAPAQTVTVNATAAANGTSRFKTIAAAMASFGEPNGANAGNAAANVIRIEGFGPFHEVLPAVMDATSLAGGAAATVRLAAGDNQLTLEGMNGRPLVLAQPCYNWSALAVRGDCLLVLRNLVLAPSPTLPPERHFISLVDGSARVRIEGCLLTALPAAATGWSGASHLPDGLADGTLAHDASYIRPTVPSENYGQALHVNANTSATVSDTVITQFASQAVASYALHARGTGKLYLLAGTRLVNNAGGLRARETPEIVMRGTRERRVYIGENNYNGRGWLQLDGYASFTMEECDCYGRPQPGNALDAYPNNCVYSAGTGSLRVRECVFAGGYAGSGGSNAFNFEKTPTSVAIDNITVLDHRYGLIMQQAMAYTVRDSIFAGLFQVANGGGSTVTLQNCALPDNDNLVLQGPINFAHPDFALRLWKESYYYSYDRGVSWQGPFAIDKFGQPTVWARTDYIVNSADECMIFNTAITTAGNDGRPYASKMLTGGMQWQTLNWMYRLLTPNEADPSFSMMPATVKVGANEYVSALRNNDATGYYTDVVGSTDGGATWSHRSTPETGGNNPAAMVRLTDGGLVIAYGRRNAPIGIRARISSNNGLTWGTEIILRDDGLRWDMGYPRMIVRPDGKLVTMYYYCTTERPQQFIAATIWDPDDLQ
jgi:hypothetical protein